MSGIHAIRAGCAALILAAPQAAAQDGAADSAADGAFTLDAPPVFAESGLAQHLLPRFSLKTRVRVDLGTPGDLTIRAEDGVTPVFMTPDTVYYISGTEDPDAARFAEWLTSDVGAATLAGFVPDDGQPAFAAPEVEAKKVRVASYDGDAARGADLSLALCGRCHVIGEINRMNGLGSTPSFAVLRAMPDWGSRFEAFYLLAPHPAFTQIEGLTPPFEASRPSPIVPMEMGPGDLEAILAFVSDLPPADLGPPIAHQ